MKELFMGIPKTKYVNAVLDAFSTDNDPKKAYNYPISYKFNSYGYRSDEFTRSETNVLTIGCSVVFGNGIPADKRFSAVFCSEFNAADWNMGWPGESVDYVGRILSTVIPTLQPNVLLVSFPSFCRREFFDAEGRRHDFRPDSRSNSLVGNKIHKNLLDLTSDYQDAVNFYKTFKLVECLCKIYNIKWLFSIRKHDDDIFNYLSLDASRRATSIEKVDLARDGGHPGVQTNLNFGKTLIDKYKEIYEKVN